MPDTFYYNALQLLWKLEIDLLKKKEPDLYKKLLLKNGNLGESAKAMMDRFLFLAYRVTSVEIIENVDRDFQEIFKYDSDTKNFQYKWEGKNFIFPLPSIPKILKGADSKKKQIKSCGWKWQELIIKLRAFGINCPISYRVYLNFLNILSNSMQGHTERKEYIIDKKLGELLIYINLEEGFLDWEIKELIFVMKTFKRQIMMKPFVMQDYSKHDESQLKIETKELLSVAGEGDTEWFLKKIQKKNTIQKIVAINMLAVEHGITAIKFPGSKRNNEN